VAGVVICPAGAGVEHGGQGLIPGAGSELARGCLFGGPSQVWARVARSKMLAISFA
jgi:hypothetical protein